MILTDTPDLYELIAELDAEDAAGVRGELIGRDDSVPRVSLQAMRRQVAVLRRWLERAG
jgi:hypothetical protein